MLLLAIGASDGLAATGPGSATTTVVTPLSLVNTAPLSFGNIVPSAAPGTVTIDEFTEARTFTGGLAMAGGTISAAKFAGLTSPTSHLKIDVPNGSITITRSGGTETMLVDNFELNGDKNDWVAANTLFELQVGARLQVGANQVPGTYVGTFQVTVNYR